MKLELGFIQIKDVQFSDECVIKDGILYVRAEDVKDFVYADSDVQACVKDVKFDIARPGESVRITPVKDVIEPRVKGGRTRRGIPRRHRPRWTRWAPARPMF
mgnify:CR=1 FL=1